ncbi:MAG: LLM class flavin-dependent oxidoreductase [Hyphomicrobiaceae bacterium]
MKLSVLDQSPIIGDATPSTAIHSTIELARIADHLGYHRFWLAEHHALRGLADASPEILLARIGCETTRIRIGTGGIMLPYYSTFKIAEQFKMLEALYPGRVDLGVGRAPGGHPRTARVLFDGRPIGGEEDFVRQLAELSAIYKGTVPEGHPLHGQIVNPLGPTAPELWVLGSSTGGAAFASHLGMRYAYANFINPHGGARVAAAYRQHFQPGHEPKPHMAVAVLAVCAESDAQAELIERAICLRWVNTAYGRETPVPTLEQAAQHQFSPEELSIASRERPRAILGTVERVADEIRAIQAAFEADEVIVVSMAPSYELRKATIEQLAKAFSL